MATALDLTDLLERVHDRETFLAFVSALAADRGRAAEAERIVPLSPGRAEPGSSESTTIESYLDAASSWARDVSALNDDRAAWFPEAPSWAAFARFLYMGKLYE